MHTQFKFGDKVTFMGQQGIFIDYLDENSAKVQFKQHYASCVNFALYAGWIEAPKVLKGQGWLKLNDSKTSATITVNMSEGSFEDPNKYAALDGTEFSFVLTEIQ